MNTIKIALQKSTKFKAALLNILYLFSILLCQWCTEKNIKPTDFKAKSHKFLTFRATLARLILVAVLNSFFNFHIVSIYSNYSYMGAIKIALIAEPNGCQPA